MSNVTGMVPGVGGEVEIGAGQDNSLMNGYDPQWATSEVDTLLENMESNNPEIKLEEFVQMLMGTNASGVTK